MHDGDFAYMIADIATGYVQNGQRTNLCGKILDPTFKLDFTGNFSKLSHIDPKGYNRDEIRLDTINTQTATRQWAY